MLLLNAVFNVIVAHIQLHRHPRAGKFPFLRIFSLSSAQNLSVCLIPLCLHIFLLIPLRQE